MDSRFSPCHHRPELFPARRVEWPESPNGTNSNHASILQCNNLWMGKIQGTTLLLS
ncbi:hypothetical protein AVEN_82940-1, partial [Araneus ventricosus]